MRKPTFCICENNDTDQLCGYRKADHAFVLATRIVQFLYFLNQNFPAFNHLLCLYSLVCVGPLGLCRTFSVCVGPVRKPHCWFSHEAPQLFCECEPYRFWTSINMQVKAHYIQKTLETNILALKV